MRLGLIDILKLSGFDPSVPCKLIRHQDRRYPVEKLRRDNWLELYQSYQCKPWFHDVQQVVSFYGLPGTRAGFYALYKVRGHKAASSGEILDSCPWSRQWNQENKFFYDLKRDQTFNDLRDRLIIDWGRGALAFVQKLSNKPILAILEPGRKLPPFNDYLEF